MRVKKNFKTLSTIDDTRRRSQAFSRMAQKPKSTFDYYTRFEDLKYRFFKISRPYIAHLLFIEQFYHLNNNRLNKTLRYVSKSKIKKSFYKISC